MPTPFPGMDPYLERPDLWPNVHSRLIVAMADDIGPKLRPRYYVSVEERTYLVQPNEATFGARPDIAVVGESQVAYEVTAAAPRSNQPTIWKIVLQPGKPAPHQFDLKAVATIGRFD